MFFKSKADDSGVDDIVYCFGLLSAI